MEQYLCELIPKTLTNIICSNYPVKIVNKETHYCSENSNGNTPCIEKEKISEIKETSLKTDDEKDTQDFETLIVFLGLSQFKMATSSFTFTIHFIPISHYLYSRVLKFPLSIIYNNYIRRNEENSYSECTLGEYKNQSSTDYFCVVQVPNTNIKQIKLQPSFNFVSQDKVLLVGISPIATISIDNIQKINNKFANLLSSNPDIFILDNAIIYRYENGKFNISGIINRDKPTSLKVNNYLTMMANIESNNNEITDEIKCIITSINNDNYILNCEIMDQDIYNFQSAVSILGEGILVINIENIIYKDENARVNYPKSQDGENNTNYGYGYGYTTKKSKSGGVNAGIIIGIILGVAAVSAAIILIIIYLRKKKRKKKFTNEPSLQAFQTF